MPHRLIADQADFDRLCEHIRASGLVAFDTEFVSEYTFRPELGLLQFATEKQLHAVDPYAVPSLDAWWDIMADDETTVVVHGGQAEMRFCLDAGRRPRKLFDVQIAEGFHGRSYPLGYAALVMRVLGKRVHGKETRTDWRRRPLTDHQIEYAVEDVKHVLKIWQKQRASLEKLGRLAWAEAEFERMIDDVDADRTKETWRRLSGVQKLSRRELAVAREIANWREREASEKNRPLRRLLRDDLIIELARRQPKNEQELVATRDMQRTEYRRVAPELVACVKRALDIPDKELPRISTGERPENNDDEQVLGQLLGIALSNRCAEMNIARQIVGTSADLRHLVRWHFDRRGPTPRLSQGWRADVCGNLLHDVLDGKISFRVADPDSDHPLIFERLEDGEPSKDEEAAPARKPRKKKA